MVSMSNDFSSSLWYYTIKEERDIMEIRELTKEVFNQFVNFYPQSSVFQTSEYAMSMNKDKYDSLYLGLIDTNTNNLVAASLILVERLGKFLYAYAPRGFLIDYENALLVRTYTTLMKKYLAKRNIIAIKICPLIVRSTYNKITDYQAHNHRFDHLFSFLKKEGYYHLGFNTQFEAFKPRFEAIIRLTKNTGLLYKSIHKSFRTKIRAGNRLGIRVYKGTKDNLKLFYELAKDNDPRKFSYFENLYEHYNSTDKIDLYFALLDCKQFLIETQREYDEQGRICGKIHEQVSQNQGRANQSLITMKINAEHTLTEKKKRMTAAAHLSHNNPDGLIIAGVLVIKHKNEAYIISEGYDKNYASLNGKHLLIWKLIEKYANEGYATFNLGGIPSPNSPNDYNGLKDFKLNFGADAVEYIGDLEYVTSKSLYMLYRNYAPLRKLKRTEKEKES